MPDLTDEEIAQHRLRHLHRGPVLRRHGPRHRVPHRSRAVRGAGHAQHATRMRWMRAKGVRFAPIWGRQAFKVDGKFKFWGGLTVESHGRRPGPGRRAAPRPPGRTASPSLYDARALALISRRRRRAGRARAPRGQDRRGHTPSAWCSPPAASRPTPRWRTRYLGPGWELAKVRGTRFNTGDGISMALDIGAMPTGNWSGCHAVGWDRNAPEFGDLAVGDNFQKHNYPFGIMVNANGERFVDEGADFRNYTYAKYGRVILMQPGQFAWQVFDRRCCTCCATNTASSASPRCAPTRCEELVREARRRRRRQGARDHQGLQRGGEDATCRSIPTSRTAAARSACAIPKSNWANTIDDAAVRGLRRHLRHHLHLRRPQDRHQRARHRHRRRSRSPACTRPASWSAASSTSTIRAAPGLMTGAVFGRIAGTTAGQRAAQVP